VIARPIDGRLERTQIADSMAAAVSADLLIVGIQNRF
jgi:hypothetical protein